MATITAVEATTPTTGNRTITWPAMGTTFADVGASVYVGNAQSITVCISVGTVAAAGVVQLQGSIDGSTWGLLANNIGTTLGTMSTAALGQTPMLVVGSRPNYIRPLVTTTAASGVFSCIVHVQEVR